MARAVNNWRGKVPRLALEYRQGEKCALCRTGVLRGALVEYRGQRICGPCAVKVAQGRDLRREERRPEECPRVR